MNMKRELGLLSRHAEDELKTAYQIPAKGARHDRIDAIKSEAAAALIGEEEGKIHPNLFGKLFKELESRVMRGSVIDTGIRIDGRDLKTVRPIVSEVGVLPARPWQRAVYARRDPGPCGGNFGHRRRRAIHRLAGRQLISSTSCCIIISLPIRSAKSAA